MHCIVIFKTHSKANPHYLELALRIVEEIDESFEETIF